MPEALKTTSGTTVSFGDVVRLSKERSKDPVAEGIERYVGLEHLNPSDLKVRSWGDVADGTTFTNVFRPGQVLFGKRRAYQRKVAVADFAGVCSGDIYVLESKGDGLLSELVPFICQSEPFYDYVISMSQGGLSPRVNWKALAAYELTLPTRKEQLQIAEILRACESVTQAARKTEAAIKQVFVAARHHLISEFSPDISSAGVVSDGPNRRCAELTLADIVESTHGIVDGPFGSNLKSEHYRDSGYPVLQSAFIASGTYDPEASEWVYVDEGKFQEQFRSAVRAGDIAMVKVGVNCGACDIVPADQPISILAGNCLKLSPNREICDTQFLLHYLKWLHEVGLLERHVTSTQQRALTLGRLKGQKLFLPPLPEQRSVAKKLDALRQGVAASIARREKAERLSRRVLTEVLA